MRQLERRVTLSVLDRKWREHLYEMDYLKEGIGLRAMAQRDPLVEYQREGYQLFNAMTDAIKEETVGYLYNLEVQVAQPEAPAVTADSAVAAAASAGAQAALAAVRGRRPDARQARGQGHRRARRSARRCSTRPRRSTVTAAWSRAVTRAARTPAPGRRGRGRRGRHGQP